MDYALLSRLFRICRVIDLLLQYGAPNVTVNWQDRTARDVEVFAGHERATHRLESLIERSSSIISECYRSLLRSHPLRSCKSAEPPQFYNIEALMHVRALGKIATAVQTVPTVTSASATFEMAMSHIRGAERRE
jgi:hypothetical protein